ncbi:MAG: hypothetical protein ABI947_30185 [Chloroflexota bacterium]
MSAKSNVTLVEITRPNAYIAMMIPHRIFVDDQKIGEVRNGKTQTFEVSPGTHEIYVKQSRFVKSNHLSVECAPNQTIRLQVTQNKPLKQTLLAVTGLGLISLPKRANLYLELLP